MAKAVVKKASKTAAGLKKKATKKAAKADKAVVKRKASAVVKKLAWLGNKDRRPVARKRVLKRANPAQEAIVAETLDLHVKMDNLYDGLANLDMVPPAAADIAPPAAPAKRAANKKTKPMLNAIKKVASKVVAAVKPVKPAENILVLKDYTVPKIDTPAEIKNLTSDYVSFYSLRGGTTGYGEKPKQKGGWTNYKNSACFAPVMGRLCGGGFRCTDTNKNGLSVEQYTEWFDLCAEHGLIHRRHATGRNKEGNYLFIPEGTFTRHQVYVAMCCHRFAQYVPKMCYVITELMKRSQGRYTFYQALHYGMVKYYPGGSGHSFCRLGGAGMMGGAAVGPNGDMSESIAVKEFMQKENTSEATDKVSTASSSSSSYGLGTNYTSEKIQTLATKLGGSSQVLVEKIINGEIYAPVSTVQYYQKYYKSQLRYKPQVALPNLIVPKLEELLTERWTPLYIMRDPTKEKLMNEYKRIAASDTLAAA